MLRKAKMFERLEPGKKVGVSFSCLAFSIRSDNKYVVAWFMTYADLLFLSYLGQRIGFWSWPWAGGCDACAGNGYFLSSFLFLFTKIC
jgi:hypothetical protein